jgi:hypothetical protein
MAVTALGCVLVLASLGFALDARIAAMIVLPSLGRVALSGRYASDGR